MSFAGGRPTHRLLVSAVLAALFFGGSLASGCAEKRPGAPVAPVEVLPTWKEPWVQDLLRSGAAPAGLALVALVLVFGLIRPALKSAFVPAPAPSTAATSKLDVMVAGDEVLPALAGEAKDKAVPALAAPKPGRIEAVRAMARENPAAVANVLRGWTSGETA